MDECDTKWPAPMVDTRIEVRVLPSKRPALCGCCCTASCRTLRVTWEASPLAVAIYFMRCRKSHDAERSVTLAITANGQRCTKTTSKGMFFSMIPLTMIMK